MKPLRACRIIGTSILILGFLGCGGSSTNPGSGPAFSSITPTPAAADLWLAVSFEPYLAPLGNITSGDVDCDGGGTMHVEQPQKGTTATTQTATYTYSHCKFTAQLFGLGGPTPVQNIQLEANGEVLGQEVVTNQDVRESESLQQHVSFSGDIGFAADCDYSAKFDSQGIPSSYSGNCTYRDSDGQELPITGDEMAAALGI